MISFLSVLSVHLFDEFVKSGKIFFVVVDSIPVDLVSVLVCYLPVVFVNLLQRLKLFPFALLLPTVVVEVGSLKLLIRQLFLILMLFLLFLFFLRKIDLFLIKIFLLRYWCLLLSLRVVLFVISVFKVPVSVDNLL
jgi:hypothetical protein